MPKYRKLYVKVVESLDVQDMPDDFTRLLWVFLPLGLCQEGRGIDNAGWVKSKLFPLRLDVTLEMIEAAMDWLDERQMIHRYSVDGRDYFCIPNETWHRYQGNTTREAVSEYPPAPDEVQDSSRLAQDLLVTNSGSSSHAYSPAYSDSDADSPSSASDDANAAQPDGAVNGDDVESIYQELLAFEMSPDMAQAIMKERPIEHIRGWLDHCRRNDGKITNPAGLLVDKLWKKKHPPPKARASPEEDRKRYVKGKFADVIRH